MLECNRFIRKRLTAMVRCVSLLLPIACVMLLLSQVVFAKNTYVINDGDRVLVHTTYSTDPVEVLNEAGLVLGKDDTFTTEEGMAMSEITVQRLQTIHIDHCGQTMTVTTYGETVQSLLSSLQVQLGKNDVISVSLDAKTYDGMQITVSRCLKQEETYTVAVPFNTLYVLDEMLAPDAQMVLIPGMEGQQQKVDEVSYVNGKETERITMVQTSVSQPVNQLIAVGSLEGIDPELIVSPDTQPEQSGPEAIIGNGQLYIGEGLIVTPDGQILTYKDVMKVVATAYTHTDPGCDMITATGTTVHIGTVAVDPRLIPYGTRMFILTDDGEYIYGISVAEDCGGSIKGHRIDLYFETDPECWTFGIRDATIYFLG